MVSRQTLVVALLASARGLVAPRLPAWAVAELAARDAVVVPGFAPRDVVEALRRDAFALEPLTTRGDVEAGDAADAYRACAQCWLAANGAGPARAERDAAATAWLPALVAALAAPLGAVSPFGGAAREPAPAALLRGAELAYLYYAGGGYYRAHLDTPEGGGGPPAGGAPRHRRAFSFLLFLTPAGFDAARDEGALRLYAPISPAEQRRRAATEHGAVGEGTLLDGSAARDIAPEPGTLVVFRSEAVPHEALPTRAPRHVLVGWLHRPLVDPT